MKFPFFQSSALALLALASPAGAGAATVAITLDNLSPANGVAYSPFFLAFHDGSFDPFNAGSAASPSIEAIAERGSGSGLAADFAATHPGGMGATLAATTNGFGPGIFLPGGSGSVTLDLDPVKNRYLSYFAMVVPSNDRFFGNDSPREIELFDANGHFTGGVFVEKGRDVWDAGTELDGLAGAAFLAGSNALDSPAQSGLITADSDFSVYGGGATPAGYNFTGLPGADTPLLRINATAAPSPGTAWLFGGALPMLPAFRRKAGQAAGRA